MRAFIGRFNDTCRDEVPGARVFDTIEQTQDVTESWLREVHAEWPRDSVGPATPLTLLPRLGRRIVRESRYGFVPERGSFAAGSTRPSPGRESQAPRPDDRCRPRRQAAI